MSDMSHVRIIDGANPAPGIAGLFDDIRVCLYGIEARLSNIEERLAVLEVVTINTAEAIEEVAEAEAEEAAGDEEAAEESAEEAAEEAGEATEEGAEAVEDMTDVDVIEVEESQEEAPVVHTVPVPTSSLPFRRN